VLLMEGLVLKGGVADRRGKEGKQCGAQGREGPEDLTSRGGELSRPGGRG